MKHLLFLAAAAFMFASTGCKPQATSATPDKFTLSIAQGKEVKIPQSKLSLKFSSISEDSRCPPDVNCIWEGVAVVDITAKDGKTTQNLQLGTRDFLPRQIVKSVSYAGYRLTLISLTSQQNKQELPVVTIQYQKENQ